MRCRSSLAVTSVVILAGSLSLQDIVEAQGIPFVLVQPLGFLIMLIAVTAELNRTPFDINEAESEIVAGFHTEYTGTKFALIYGAEYVAALGWSAVIVTLFFAGWKPDIGGILWFALKTSLIVFLFFWFRGTWPRVRIDQMLALAWKLLFPLATINILVTAGEVLGDAGAILAGAGRGAACRRAGHHRSHQHRPDDRRVGTVGPRARPCEIRQSVGGARRGARV